MHKQTEELQAPRRVTSDLVDKAISQPSTESEQQTPPQKLPDRLLERLWLKMAEMYGHRWTSNFGERADPDSAWATVLQGLTGQHLANGLNALVHKGEEFDWPPPANVFRVLCLEVPGLPSDDEAWVQALRGTYGHLAVKVAAEATGAFDLRTAKLGDKALRKVFSRNYAIVRARAAMGKPLDGEIPKALEHERKTPMQVQFARSHQEARDLITAQGLPTDPKQARALLLAKMGIRRGGQAHG